MNNQNKKSANNFDKPFNSQRQKHKEQRKELWIRAWCATANANDCKYTSTATKYADTALEEFDKRFKLKKRKLIN